MTQPQPLTAFDTHGKPFLRALLREGTTAETVTDLRGILERERATFTLDQIAAEVDARLPVTPVGPNVERRARLRPKVRF